MNDDKIIPFVPQGHPHGHGEGYSQTQNTLENLGVEFVADFEVNPNGAIIYDFETGLSNGPTSSHPFPWFTVIEGPGECIVRLQTAHDHFIDTSVSVRNAAELSSGLARFVANSLAR